MSESGGQSIVSHDVGGISTVKSRCDLKGSIVDACLSDDANRIVLITDLGDAFMVSDNSKWVLNSRDKASVIGLEYGHIERVDKRVEHLEELVFSVLDRLTLMHAFNKEVFTSLIVSKSREMNDQDRSNVKELVQKARQSIDSFSYIAAKKVMKEDYIWESQRLIDELLASKSQKDG